MFLRVLGHFLRFESAKRVFNDAQSIFRSLAHFLAFRGFESVNFFYGFLGCIFEFFGGLWIISGHFWIFNFQVVRGNFNETEDGDFPSACRFLNLLVLAWTRLGDDCRRHSEPSLLRQNYLRYEIPIKYSPTTLNKFNFKTRFTKIRKFLNLVSFQVFLPNSISDKKKIIVKRNCGQI